MTHSRIPAAFLPTIVVFLIACGSLPLRGQQATAANTAVVPPLVQFGGVLTNGNGKPISEITGITFYLYQEQEGGTPLWMETQNVQPDETGHYSVMLGSATTHGLPADLFASGEAHWLGVQVQGEEEQPRVMLLSVPYALKSGDAQTVGGLPPSAFVLAAPVAAAGSTAASADAATTVSQVAPAAITGSGTSDYVPLWTGTSALGNSVLFQSGTGSTAKVGINTTTPASTLDVKGSATVRGALALPSTGTSTASAGTNSQPVTLTTSSFSSSSGAAVSQNFRWQAEPAGNNTSSPSGTLNLLFGSGSSTPSETGLHIASNGQITFAPGQTFPGGGSGTITGVTAGTDLTGGGTTGNVTLNVDTTKVPQLNTANAFTGNQTVNGNLSATGTVSGSSFEIGSNLFAFGSVANSNAFLGFAGNTTMTGTSNTATGVTALHANTTGSSDTASGMFALYSNTMGEDNTASGAYALSYNTTGSFITASGAVALNANTTGNYNTGNGAFSLRQNTTGSNNTASGSYALYANTTGNYNTANGVVALDDNTTGNYNTASGANALDINTTGNYNTGNGAFALNGNITGNNNTASGYSTLYFSTGSTNTASGAYALYNNTTGSSNTANGADALFNNTTGAFNTAFGFGAGPDPSAPALSNSTAIGAFADVLESNALVLGSSADYNGIANVLVGIDVPNPTNILTVLQGGGSALADGWSTYSSRRWKTNIHPLQNALGKVEQLRGVSYDLKNSGKHEIGVIAEEVGAVVPELVSYEANGKDARGVDYSRLTALLIEAVKQQQREIRNLSSELRETRQSLQKIKTQMGSTQPALEAQKAPGSVLRKP